jgi:hypothetical protein
MSKVLVFSGPYDDKHKSYVVTSKSLSFVEYILNTNEWSDLGDGYIFELDDDFVELVERELERKLETKDDIIEYFSNISKSPSYTVEKYSNLLINIIPHCRGSWCSYVWVNTGNK